jgi:O-antigen/teichoic acid export membrane protein
MSIRQNIFANYVGQFYVTLVGILLVPMYVRYMGPEAYGLVGFYAMLQAWFMLLDMGLTPTLARETARYQGGVVDALSLARLLRVLEVVFVGVAVVGAVAMMAGANSIATRWLKVQFLPMEEVTRAVVLMAMIIALRWVCGLYRGAITGFERLIWLNGFNVAVATLRFALVVVVLIYVGTTPTYFFGYQLIVAVIEVTVLTLKTYSLMPRLDGSERTAWQWSPLLRVLRFSLTIAFTGAVWVLVTQTDKLILSKLLPLSDYAYFTLAVMVASGILVASGPVSAALLPRMTRLNAERDDAGLLRLYRHATQLVAAVAIPAALVLAVFAEQVLLVWTGDMNIAQKSAPVLSLYATGNCLLALAAFPYYMQFAKGDLKLHLIGNLGFVLVFIPLLIFTTNKWGVMGAGYAWIIANLLPFLTWLPLVHMRFFAGLHRKWLMHDVLAIAIWPAILIYMLHRFVTWPGTRWPAALYLGLIGIATCIAAALGSSWIRGVVRLKIDDVLSHRPDSHHAK